MPSSTATPTTTATIAHVATSPWGFGIRRLALAGILGRSRMLIAAILAKAARAIPVKAARFLPFWRLALLLSLVGANLSSVPYVLRVSNFFTKAVVLALGQELHVFVALALVHAFAVVIIVGVQAINEILQRGFTLANVWLRLEHFRIDVLIQLILPLANACESLLELQSFVLTRGEPS